jgi:hypothetical protein
LKIGIQSRFRRLALLFALWLILIAQRATAETISASNSESVSLTIYNQNFGVVKDVHTVELKQGSNYVRFQDVAAKIDPTSVSFVSLTAPNSVVVREQNYQYDLLDPTTILSRSIGKNIRFRQYLSNGQTHEVSGVLLNSSRSTIVDTAGSPSVHSQGLVVQTPNGIVLNPVGEAELQELPTGLVPKPSLLWKLEATKAGTHKAEISYQTSGINWRCDYVAIANENDSKCNLTSWVTIDNRSGGTYKHAGLKLLAGDVHHLQAPVPKTALARTMMATDGMVPQFQEHAFAEYHMYALQGKTDVNDNETKQLSLFEANNVSTKQRYVFEPEAATNYPLYYRPRVNQKINVKLEIENNKANGLGVPMPKGKVRIYKRDKDASLEFIGEDIIDHTPRDEKLRLYVGDAFDLVGERRQTIQKNVSPHLRRQSFEISLRNHKDKAVEITDIEHAYGDCKILSSSNPYNKRDAYTFEFTVSVPPHQEVKITYTTELKY